MTVINRFSASTCTSPSAFVSFVSMVTRLQSNRLGAAIAPAGDNNRRAAAITPECRQLALSATLFLTP
jgi:hypothetical protein